MLTLLLPIMLAAALGSPPETDGAQLYAVHCASCHGAHQDGTADGPSLHGVGLAAVDFFLSTGRMPAAVSWVEIEHRGLATGGQLPLSEIRSLERYLAPVVAGGPPIPEVAAGSDRTRGVELYQLDCQQCHAIKGEGGSIGASDWAPSLEHATINDIADAIRAGPDQMPRFSERQLDQGDLNDLAGYVISLESTRGPTWPPYGSTGPIPEGAVGYVALMALVTFVVALSHVKERE